MAKNIYFDSSCFVVQKNGKINAKKRINDIVKKNISEERFVHSQSVAQLSYDIAVKHNLKDPLKYFFAGLTHDIAKFIDKNKERELMNTVVEKKYQCVDEYAFHSFIAPFILKSEFNITDSQILNAVRFHCTGKKTMSTMEKVIYASDKIDPSRGYDSSDMIYAMMNMSINKGFVYVLNKNKEFLDNKKNKFNENVFSIECFDHYLGTNTSDGKIIKQ
jgi:predicted HD superfamily hydrolase involved in NAD metabolism